MQSAILVLGALALFFALGSDAQLITEAQFKCAAKTKGGNPPSSYYTAFTSSLARAQITTKAEAAKYLAHSSWETVGWQYTREQYCVNNMEACRTAYYNTGKGRADKIYYGRGMLQLTWDYNYYDASQALYGNNNLIDNPDQVADNPSIGWSTAAWFWSSRAHPTASTFGNTLKAINSIECDGGPNSENRVPRFNHYKQVLSCVGIPAPADSDGYCRYG